MNGYGDCENCPVHKRALEIDEHCKRLQIIIDALLAYAPTLKPFVEKLLENFPIQK